MAISIKYGEHESQVGDIYLPIGDCKGVICFFHGGLWKMPYDRFQANGIAAQLTTIGYCVWNIEYRRVGETGRVWQDTFRDAVKSMEFLPVLKEKYPNINLDNVIVAGHSAGDLIILHGIEDEAVPVEWSRKYLEVAKEQGKSVKLVEIENCSHIDFLDPQSIAFQKFAECLMD